VLYHIVPRPCLGELGGSFRCGRRRVLSRDEGGRVVVIGELSLRHVLIFPYIDISLCNNTILEFLESLI
jgi:hypothetical protein